MSAAEWQPWSKNYGAGVEGSVGHSAIDGRFYWRVRFGTGMGEAAGNEATSVAAIAACDAAFARSGRKDDAGKPRWDLVQPKALTAYVRVLTFGAQNYAPENWRRVPEPTRRYLAAALRHVMAYLGGEKRDAETGENHLAHAMCCLAFVLELDEEASP